VLPELRLESATFVVSTALATRDFPDVHHDRDVGGGPGLEGHLPEHPDHHRLVTTFVTDWAGRAPVLGVKVRLGVPCYAGDILTLSGRVAAVHPEVVVEVIGALRAGQPRDGSGSARVGGVVSERSERTNVTAAFRSRTPQRSEVVS